jgi:glycine/serine hydroxymethyltransferase
MREYQKHEFCESVKCKAIAYSLNNTPQCGRYSDTCIKTAKQFHQWLKANGFKIVKDHCQKCKSYHEQDMYCRDCGRTLKLKDGE